MPDAKELQIKIDAAKKWLKNKSLSPQSRKKFEELLAGYTKELASTTKRDAMPKKTISPNETIWDCPSCTGKLVRRRNTKTGNPFLGCSNYPKCTYVQNDEEL